MKLERKDDHIIGERIKQYIREYGARLPSVIKYNPQEEQEIIGTALQIYDHIAKTRYYDFTNGKNPKTRAADLLYWACLFTQKKISMKEIAQTFGILPSTISSHALGMRFWINASDLQGYETRAQV